MKTSQTCTPVESFPGVVLFRLISNCILTQIVLISIYCISNNRNQHENYYCHRPFPSWPHLSRLRTERLPPLHSQLSAVGNGWPVRRGALCLPLSGPDISAPSHFGGPAPGQPLRPTRADAARSDHREYSAHSHIDASERSASGSRRDGAMDGRVSECPLRLRRSFPTACYRLNKNHQPMQIGVDSFVAATVDAAGRAIDPARHLNELLEAVTLADQVGLDVFGIGEHHRREFLDS